MSKRGISLGVRGGLVIALVVALSMRGTAGLVLGLGAAAGLISVVVLEGRRASSAIRRVRKRLEDCQKWIKPIPLGEPEESDPYADDRITGRWTGCQVWVASTELGVQVAAALEKWPDGLAVERRGTHEGDRTGDAAFDRVVRVVGDAAHWRCTLTEGVRRRLVELCGHAPLTVRDRRLDMLLGDADADKVEIVLDLVAALAASLPVPGADSMAQVFQVALAEPIAAVRAGHYRWLVERGWNVPEVVRAAAADTDPAICTWGASQLAPSEGVFR